jgi:hypothetical protein
MVMQTNRKARMFKKWTRRLYLLQDVRVIAGEYCNFRLLKGVWSRWSSYLEVKRVVVETDDNEIKDGLHVEMLSDASKGKGIDKEADVEEEDAILDTQKLVEGTVAKIESEEAIIDVEASFRKPVIELELKDAILVDQDHVGEEEPSDAILDAKEELVQDPAAEAENKQEIPKVGIPEIQDPVQEPVVQVGEDNQQPTDFVVQTEPDSGIPDSQESFKELLAVGELYHSFSVQKRSFKHWYLFKKQLQTNDLASSFHVFKSKVACIKRWMQLYQYRFEMQCLAEDLNMFNTQKMVLRKLIRLVGFREDLEDTASLFHEFSVMKKGWRSWLLKSKSMGRFMEIAVQLHVMQRQLVYFHYWTDQLHSVKAKSNLIAHLQIVDDKPLVEPETDTASSAEEQVAALFDVFQTLKRNFKLWKQKLDKSKQIHLLATKWSVQLVLKRSFDHWSFIAIEHHDVKFGELCYRKHLVRKYWNEWISSQIMLEKATRANNKWLLNRYYRNWNQSVNFSIANRFDQFRMSISCVRRWKERYEIRLANFEEAVDLHREFLVLRMFHHWYKTCAYVLKQELEAIQVYDSNLLLKCYSAWNTVVKEPSFVPLYHYRTYFSAWKESSRRTRLAVELQENQAQKRYLLKWQARLYKKNKLLKQMKSLQAGVKRFRALKTKQVFKIWGTLLLEKMLREKKWIDSLTRVWNVWSYKASGLALIKLKRNASLQKSSFKKWLTKKDTFVARSVKGIEFDKQRCYKKVMQTWKVQYFVSRSRTSVLKSAMLQWQRMYLKKVKFRMIKDHMEKKIAKRSLMKRFIKWKSLLVKQPPLSAKKYFCKWKARTSRIKEKQEMIKLYWNRWKSQFQKETFHTTRKVIFAETWHEKQLLRKVLKGWMSTNGKEPVQLVHTSRSFSLGGSLYITKI